ncbi:hypothetical protein C8R44DRAFT_629801 [Mycena epipterygia]|nr:hypothetical protein C8R44DRAFT_629801 [Mycena epipterygia]
MNSETVCPRRIPTSKYQSHSQLPRLPRQTALAIGFVVIGASVTGLACAIALRRVGHRVLVIEQKENIDATQEAIHMYPNVTRVFYSWGFREALREMTKEAEKAAVFSMRDFATGNILGVVREPDENTTDDIMGELLCVNHGDLLKYLYGMAISLGARVRFSAQAVAVDGGQRVLTLSSGETLHADVVIGTDLQDGVTRPLLLEEQDADELTPCSATIPKELVCKDPELEQAFYGNDEVLFGSIIWLGKGLAARICPVVRLLDILLRFTIALPGIGTSAFRRGLSGLVRGEREPFNCRGLKHLCALARVSPSLRVVPLWAFQPLEDWVCENRYLIAIGNAAYPFYSGGTGGTAMTGIGPEDGAILAKLFSHLSRKNQITDFLTAFHEMRHPRCEATANLYRQVLVYLMGSGPPPKETAPDAPQEAGSTPTISEGTDVWWYDADDHAEEWWVAWGLLKERSIGAELDVSPLHVERAMG